MKTNWQKVFESDQQYRAEIVKDYLDDLGMSPVLVSKKDSAYHFGHYEVQVEEEYVLLAIKKIQDEIHFE